LAGRKTKKMLKDGMMETASDVLCLGLAVDE
jgi:hypothetical protein